MRVLVDYRPALQHRSGVGEYIAQLFGALAAQRPNDDALYLFSSSWRDRVSPEQIPAGTTPIDVRIPVRVLNLAWHRFNWPPVERITGIRFDVVHAPHPLLIPSTHGARVVTVHDLHFLHHQQDTTAEVRRDYAALVERHAHLADHVVVNSAHTAGEVETRLGVPRHHITVCRPGSPGWPVRAKRPGGGPILFVGTLEPRKNVGTLLDAYARLVERRRDVPELVLAGRPTAAAAPWLARLKDRPLAGRVHHLGYVSDDTRRQLYESARLLVLPSVDEGFGLPVLEAMSVGLPVVASNRGALPEVLGDAGLLAEPDVAGLEAAIERFLSDPDLERQCAARGLRRANTFTWADSARTLRGAYESAVARRGERRARRARP